MSWIAGDANHNFVGQYFGATNHARAIGTGFTQYGCGLSGHGSLVGGGRSGGGDAPRAERPPRRESYRSAPAASRDPFFDKPYEASAGDTAPAWEPSTARPAVRSISANIKPKRRVAALFKTDPVPEPEASGG